MDLESGVRVCRIKDQLSCDLNGEIAILNLKSKKYFGLSEVGAFIWERLESPTTPDALILAVAKNFEVEQDQCAADVREFLDELAKAGLVQESQS